MLGTGSDLPTSGSLRPTSLPCIHAFDPVDILHNGITGHNRRSHDHSQKRSRLCSRVEQKLRGVRFTAIQQYVLVGGIKIQTSCGPAGSAISTSRCPHQGPPRCSCRGCRPAAGAIEIGGWITDAPIGGFNSGSYDPSRRHRRHISSYRRTRSRFLFARPGMVQNCQTFPDLASKALRSRGARSRRPSRLPLICPSRGAARR